MRALDMLQMASSPIISSSRRADPQLRTATRTSEEKLGFLQTNFEFQPRVNPAVPDYEALYKAFQRRAAKRRNTREVTRNKPFLLRTTSLRSTQRPCEAAAAGEKRVRAQAVGGGSEPEAQNPGIGQVSMEGTSHDIFIVILLKHWFSCNQICSTTIPINLRSQESFLSFPLSVRSSRSGRQGVGVNCCVPIPVPKNSSHLIKIFRTDSLSLSLLLNLRSHKKSI